MNNSTKIDFLSCERHNFSHLKPIWDFLPPEHRGVFYILTQLDKKEEFIGIDEVESKCVFESQEELTERLNADNGLLVTSTFYDIFLPEICRPLVFVAHGGGQTFKGQPLHLFARKNYVLDILPNEHMAQVFQQRYPYTQKHAVGSPKLDKWHIDFKKPENEKPVVAISFHFDRQTVPETRTSWPHFKNTLPLLARQDNWKILGHGHPRMIDTLIPHYEKLGIEIVKDFDEVIQRADLYVCDHMATLYEFASTDRPVVVLNAPWYRRDVEHGLRFWEHADVGINCDQPKYLMRAIDKALEDPFSQQQKRKKAVKGVYSFTDGKASERAAKAILNFSRDFKSTETLFLYPGTTEQGILDYLNNHKVSTDVFANRFEYHQHEILKTLNASKKAEFKISLSDMEFHYWALTLFLLKSGKKDEAAKIYNDYKKLNSNSKYLWVLDDFLSKDNFGSTQSPDMLYQKGVDKLRSNNFNETLRIFDNILERIDPLHLSTIETLRVFEGQLPSNWLKARETRFLEKYKNKKSQKNLLQACQFNNSPRIINFIYNEVMKPKDLLPSLSKYPVVSMIIPCFNGKQTIHKTVHSVMNQSYSDYELIIIDDSSTDGSWDEIKKIRSLCNKNLITKRLKTNSGVSKARNIGAGMSRGDFLVFLDCGDEIVPTYLEKMLEAAKINPEYDWYYPVTLQKGTVNRFWSFKEFSEKSNLSKNLQPVTSLMKKSLFKTIGGFSEEFQNGYEDWNFWVDAVQNGFKGKLVRKILFVYNKIEGSRNILLQGDNLKEYKAKLQIIEKHPALYKPLNRKDHEILQNNLRIHPGLIRKCKTNPKIRKPSHFDYKSTKYRVQFYVYKNVHWPMFEEIYKFLLCREDVKEIIICLPDLMQLDSQNYEFIERLMSLDATLVSRPRTNVDVTFIADAIAGKVAGCGKIVNVGHGTISKGYYFTDSVWTQRENWVDLLCVPGKYAENQLSNILSTKVAATGMAKLDPVFKGQYNREYLCQKLNIDSDKKIILYAPTFNIDLSSVFNFADDFHKLARKDACVLIKLHGSTLPYLVSQYKRTADNTPGIFFVDDPNLAPYLGGADIMISDVSSAFMEFMAMDKPVILYNNPNRANYHGFNPDNIEYKWRDLGTEVSSLDETRKALNTLIEQGDEKRSSVRQAYASELFSDLSGNACASIWEEARKVIQTSAKAQVPWFSVVIRLTPENLFAVRALVDNVQFNSVMPIELILSVSSANSQIANFIGMLEQFSQFNVVRVLDAEPGQTQEKLLAQTIEEASGDFLLYIDEAVKLYKNFDYILYKTFQANPDVAVLTGTTLSEDHQISCSTYIPLPDEFFPDRYSFDFFNKYKGVDIESIDGLQNLPLIFAFRKEKISNNSFEQKKDFSAAVLKNAFLCLSLFYTSLPLDDMQVVKNFFKQEKSIPVDTRLEILKTIRQKYNFPDLNEHLIFDSLRTGKPAKDLVSYVWPSLYMRYYDITYKEKLLNIFSDFPSIKNILQRDIALINKLIVSDKNSFSADNFGTDNLPGLHQVQDDKGTEKANTSSPPGDNWKDGSDSNHRSGGAEDTSRKNPLEHGKDKKRDCPRIMFYFFKNVHIPVIISLYNKFKQLYPEHKTAFGCMRQAPEIRAGFTRDELEYLRSFGEDIYLDPQEFAPDVTFIADSVYPWVQGCGKLVHVGHGVLSKGQYYTDTKTASREEQADLVCVPGKYHQGMMRRIITRPVMATGMAKLDPLFSGKVTRRDVVRKFGLPKNRKYILFAPTFNDELSAIPHVMEDITKVIPEKDCFLLIKLHGSTKQEYKDMYKNLPQKDQRVIYADDLDITPFLALADLMISDVSSAMMEFAALDKPLVLFNNPDREKYGNYNPQDIEFQWRDIGIETTGIAELREAVMDSLKNPQALKEKRKEYTDQLFANKYDGLAAERIIRAAMKMF